jgi:hypothetical protein
VEAGIHAHVSLDICLRFGARRLIGIVLRTNANWRLDRFTGICDPDFAVLSLPIIAGEHFEE